MHEYSIVQALIERVEELARDRKATAVRGVLVSIGELAGVEPELLATAYDTFRERTVCDGAPLTILPVAARWDCPPLPAGDPARRDPRMRAVRRAGTPGRGRRDRVGAHRDGGGVMCGTCGCGDPELVPVEVHDRILAGNDRTAGHNREHFLHQKVFAVNLMGSPGAGKTAILEATARRLGERARIGAVAGDLETDRDAQRLRAAGIPSVAITTGSACHLDAELVHRALHDFPWQDLDLLFIENVGNLVCPAIYDLGQAANVVALSVTEGEDKPLKYPVMFRTADLVLLTKTDLLPHLSRYRLDAVRDALARVNPVPALLPISAESGEGLSDWIAWLEQRRFSTAESSADAVRVGR